MLNVDILLTKDEHRAIWMAGELAALVNTIIGDGPNADDDRREMFAAIHVIQRAVGFNAVARAYPLLYRRMGVRMEGTDPSGKDDHWTPPA